jgi:hypothetical protein
VKTQIRHEANTEVIPVYRDSVKTRFRDNKVLHVGIGLIGGIIAGGLLTLAIFTNIEPTTTYRQAPAPRTPLIIQETQKTVPVEPGELTKSSRSVDVTRQPVEASGVSVEPQTAPTPVEAPIKPVVPGESPTDPLIDTSVVDTNTTTTVTPQIDTGSPKTTPPLQP